MTTSLLEDGQPSRSWATDLSSVQKQDISWMN
uniref:Uncharacterized protein n=1 Tax=Arundo donax TaxID=35708 RepID=A0A0A9HB52_ARUDO